MLFLITMSLLPVKMSLLFVQSPVGKTRRLRSVTRNLSSRSLLSSSGLYVWRSGGEIWGHFFSAWKVAWFPDCPWCKKGG